MEDNKGCRGWSKVEVIRFLFLLGYWEYIFGGFVIVSREFRWGYRVFINY